MFRKQVGIVICVIAIAVLAAGGIWYLRHKRSTNTTSQPGQPTAPVGPSSRKASVVVTVETPDASVYIDGVKVGSSAPGRFVKEDLDPGRECRLEATKEGYADHAEQIRLKPGENLIGPIRLAAVNQDFAVLYITSNLHGCRFKIISDRDKKVAREGIIKDKSEPIEDLEPGTYTFVLAKPGYYEGPPRTVALKAGVNPPVRFELRAKPAVVSLTVKSTGNAKAIQARVQIDGQGPEVFVPGGTKTLDVEAEKGHTFLVKSDGFEPRRIDVPPLGPEQRHPVEVRLQPIKPLYAALVIEQLEPVDAVVMLDGEPASKRLDGSGQLAINDIAQGSHRLTIRRRGYEDYESPIEFMAGQTVRLPRIKLNQQSGSVKFQVEPQGSKAVFTNVATGQRWDVPSVKSGDTPMNLPPGEYSVEINQEACFPYQTKIKVNAAAATLLPARLISKPGYALKLSDLRKKIAGWNETREGIYEIGGAGLSLLGGYRNYARYSMSVDFQLKKADGFAYWIIHAQSERDYLLFQVGKTNLCLIAVKGGTAADQKCTPLGAALAEGEWYKAYVDVDQDKSVRWKLSGSGRPVVKDAYDVRPYGYGSGNLGLKAETGDRFAMANFFIESFNDVAK